MFFDVCHSTIREREDLLIDPASQLLAPMRDAVRRPRPWAFVGISTGAYEIELAPHHEECRLGGILMDALYKGIRGEPCHRDEQPCPAKDCIITVDFLLPKLLRAVAETAAANGCEERVSFLVDQDSRSTRIKIGLAVRGFVEKRFREASLPQEAELLAKQAVEDSEAFLWP